MLIFNNSGDGPLQVPGFGEIPLNYRLCPGTRFAHGLVEYRQKPRLTMREMAMLRVMQRITEQSRWHEALLGPDETRLAEWHREAEVTEKFLISEAAWEWCLAELRDKARTWQETGRLLVYDSSSAVCQADVSLPIRDIQEEMSQLGKQASHDSPIVNPFEFPLVYDRSQVLVDGGSVPMDDLWRLTGHIATELPAKPNNRKDPWYTQSSRNSPSFRSNYPREHCWSNRFQWLPCEVEFRPSTIADDTLSVRITSYVNNLHPYDHRAFYGHLENLISCSIPSWNEILFYGDTRGLRPPRILTYGCRIQNYREDHEVFKGWQGPFLDWRVQCDSKSEWDKKCDEIREYALGPEPPVWKQANPVSWQPANLLESITPEQWEIPKYVNRILWAKRARRAWFDHPEPGISFSYEQWKQGRFTGQALVPQRLGNYPDPLHHDHIPVRLEEKFSKEGLQVIVQVSRIDLTPQSPSYRGEANFHTEGLRNENIVATTMYVVEAENITQARVSFQQEDKIHASELECVVPEAISTILDIDYREPGDWGEAESRRAVHTFGSVPLAEGRLMSWPNTLRSKEEPFTLLDPSQPGHLTVIKLRLVDPHCRICSTRNVPPQQHHWWSRTAREASNLDSRLPPELVHIVMEQTDYWPMSGKQAQDLREDFRRDHERAQEAAVDGEGYHLSLLL